MFITILNNILPSIKERHIRQCLSALKRNIPVILVCIYAMVDN